MTDRQLVELVETAVDTDTLWNRLKGKGVTSTNTINSTLSKMVEDCLLSRVAKGCYATVDGKVVFKAKPLENKKNAFNFLKGNCRSPEFVFTMGVSSHRFARHGGRENLG